jgi:hypothetical protein
MAPTASRGLKRHREPRRALRKRRSRTELCHAANTKQIIAKTIVTDPVWPGDEDADAV